MNWKVNPKMRKEVEDYIRENNIPESEGKEIMESVRNFYVKALYDPEEAVGVVTAQSLSEPATQMSTSPYEKLILKRNGTIAVVEIGKFVDSVVEKLGKKIDGWDVCDISSEGVRVPSITDKEKAEWSLVKAVSRHKAPKKLLKITTFSGRQITATDSHSFMIRKDNKIVPVAGSDLNLGDRIPVMKYLPENCINEVSISEHISHNVKESSGLLYTTKQSKPVPNKLNLDSHFGWFIGAYLSEGNSQGNQINISNINESFISNAKAFAEKIGLGFRDRKYIGEFGRSRTLTISSAILSKFIISVCGTGSKNKMVPNFAYNANEEFVSGLLRGYFDGDGNFHPERNMTRTSSNSKELLDGICLLLARFGIFAYKVKAQTQHGLLIPYKYAPIFLEKIGSDIPKKGEALEKTANHAKNYWNKKSQDFTDMIGGFGDVLYRAAKKLKYPTRYVNNFTKRQRIGRTTLYRYIKLFERIATEKNVDISSELELMRSMHSSDFVWDKIISIEPINPHFKYVYDLTVEGTETFTTFEGVVTHNTMRTYHFAGTAGIQVTLGLPRLIEIFDAKKEPETPSMTIYLKSEDQTENKAIEVAKRIKEVKLRDFVLSDVIDLVNLTVKCALDSAKLKRFDLEPKDLAKHIKLKNIECEIKGNELTGISKKMENVNLHKLKYKLLESHIRGVKGVSHVIVSKDEKGEWIITTLGSNLKKVFEIEGIDPARTICNNPFEIYDILGIEAARNSIIKEAVDTIEEQGLGVDIRYVSILADLMTSTGRIMGIGRYGIAGHKDSVLARMAFEETKKHIISASVDGTKDPLKGHVENIIMNQLIPMGTGAFELIGRIPEGKPKPERPEKKAPERPEKKAVKKPKPVKPRSKKPVKKPAKKPAKRPVKRPAKKLKKPKTKKPKVKPKKPKRKGKGK